MKMFGLIGIGLLAAVAGCGGGDTGPGGEIVVTGRQSSSGTYDYFRERVLGKKRDFSNNILDQSGSKAVVELIASTPGAIGYSGMGYVTEEVKMLPVSDGGDAIAPTVENAVSGAYPLARPLYMYTLGEPEGALKHYIDWIMSDAGQQIIIDNGYVPLKQSEYVTLEGTPGDADVTIDIKGSDTLVNVAGRWAEAYKKQFSNIRPEVSGGGSGTGIAALIDGSVDIANASRPMKPEEIEKASQNSGTEIKEFIVGRDALAIYVHKDNPLNEISIKDLAEIYGDGGEITEWSQVTGWPKDE